MELITSRICMTKDIGICGNMFGGNLLSTLDEAGALFAARKVESKNVVTLKIEEVIFHKPIKVGDLIQIFGSLLSVGNTSITIRLIAKALDPQTQKEVDVCSTNMVFVRVNDQGLSEPIDKGAKEKLQLLLNM